MFGRKLVGSLGAGVVALGIAAAAAPAQAATFTVYNTDSWGKGSLRTAMSAAEVTDTRDEILFEIPGEGVHTIALDVALPVISKPLTIDGYSQLGANPATEDSPAEPKIVIDAANVARGLDVGGDDIEIRGLVVKNAQEDGIVVDGRANTIAGNHIGTNATGDDARPNDRYAVSVAGGDNVIGGPDPEDRNVISGSLFQVIVTDGSGNVVEGNRIGTNAAGTARLSGGTGVGVLLGSSGDSLRDNQIAGLGEGVVVSGDDNVLQGNDIGTGASGKHAVANFLGILVDGGDDNLIGGTAEGEGNLVSGNRSDGIRLDERATGNDLQGNLIGTTFTGRAPLPNEDDGVTINNSSENTIGGTQPGAGNVISANAGDGVSLEGFDVVEANRVLGNWIGTNKTAQRDLGNGGSGVHIGFGDDNTVGDDDETSPLNMIMHNGEDGVTIENGFGNSVLRSVMADNGNLAIDLGGDGSTANDPNDLDFGSNGLQNGPEIEEATTASVEWELETTPNAFYRLEFYACDGPGAGEGATYLGSTTTFTDANGNADDTTTLPTPVEAGDHVAMTATRTTFAGVLPNLVLVTHDTSELSPCEEVE
jgi:trimeric autotransporter adhesin